MGRVTIFITGNCSFCQKSILILHNAGVDPVEINLDRYPKRRENMILLTKGQKTVPQLFFNDRYIGGFDTVVVLNDTGQLASLLRECLSGPDPIQTGLRRPDELDANLNDTYTPQTGYSEGTTRLRDKDLYYDKLMTMLKHNETGLPIAHRMHKMQSYRTCFVGSEMVDWLIANIDPSLSREDAVFRAQAMMDSGLFNHVGRSEPFRDAYVFYRFLEDEEIELLNMKQIFHGQPEKPSELASKLSNQMKDICKAYVDETGVEYTPLRESLEWKQILRTSTELQRMDISPLTRAERIAFYLNTYNLLALHATVMVGSPQGALSRSAFVNTIGYNIGGMTYTLNDIYHGLLRNNKVPPGGMRRPFCNDDPRKEFCINTPDPRCNFAVHMGLKSCPPLRPYTDTDIEMELHMATSYVGRSVEVSGPEVLLPMTYKWYHADFGSTDTEMCIWLKPFLSSDLRDLLSAAMSSVSFMVRYKPTDLSATLIVVPRAVTPSPELQIARQAVERERDTLYQELDQERVRAKRRELQLEMALGESKTRSAQLELELKRLAERVDRLEWNQEKSLKNTTMMSTQGYTIPPPRNPAPYFVESYSPPLPTETPIPQARNMGTITPTTFQSTSLNKPPIAPTTMEYVPPKPNDALLNTQTKPVSDSPPRFQMTSNAPSHATLPPVPAAPVSGELSKDRNYFNSIAINLGYLVHLKLAFEKADTAHQGYLDLIQLGEWAVQCGMKDVTYDRVKRMIKQIDVYNQGVVTFWAFVAMQVYTILNLQTKVDLHEWVKYILGDMKSIK